MASKQDLETRIMVLEDKLNWLFNVMQQQIAVPTLPGAPPKMVQRTFHEVYRDERQFLLAKQAEKLLRDRGVKPNTAGTDDVKLDPGPDVPTQGGRPDPVPPTVQHTPPPALDTDPGPAESFAEFQQRLKRESGLA